MSAHATPTPRRPGLFYRVMMAFLGLFDRWLHMSCRSFVQVASESHERKLTRVERFRQAVHRLMCRMCRVQEQRLAQIRTLAQDLGHTGHEHSQACLCSEAKERIKLAMLEASREEEPGSEPPAA
jgi:hypothetical protein